MASASTRSDEENSGFTFIVLSVWVTKTGAERGAQTIYAARLPSDAATVVPKFKLPARSPDAQPPRHPDFPVSPAARGESRRLVSLGRRSARAGADPEQTDPAFRRLLGMPLVPRHGPRVV